MEIYTVKLMKNLVIIQGWCLQLHLQDMDFLGHSFGTMVFITYWAANGINYSAYKVYLTGWIQWQMMVGFQENKQEGQSSDRISRNQSHLILFKEYKFLSSFKRKRRIDQLELLWRKHWQRWTLKMRIIK